MPKFLMLIGVPGVGKTSWSRILSPYMVRLSTDDEIEFQASIWCKPYREIWEESIKDAEKGLQRILERAILMNDDMVWDQTNLSIKSRAKKLSRIPASYEKIAVHFITPPEHILVRRNEERKATGRDIPVKVLHSMIDQLQPPSFVEGFNQIITVNSRINE